MKDEIKEIKLEKRKPTFDYILNDLALDSLMFRVVNGIGSSQDKFDFDYQVKLMQKEISRLRKNIYNATEYLKDNACYSDGEFCDDLDYCYCKDLLNILQGDDKDE